MRGHMAYKSLEIKGLSQRMWCTNRLLWRTNSDFYGIQTPRFMAYEQFYWGWGWSLICWCWARGTNSKKSNQRAPNLRAATLQKCESDFFSVFLCQRCREIWREIFWWNFPRYVFQGLGVRGKISPKFHVKNGVKNGQFHANFTLLGRSADKPTRICTAPLTRQTAVVPSEGVQIWVCLFLYGR